MEKEMEERAKRRLDEKTVIHGLLREDGVIVSSSEDIEGLTSRGYGTS